MSVDRPFVIGRHAYAGTPGYPVSRRRTGELLGHVDEDPATRAWIAQTPAGSPIADLFVTRNQAAAALYRLAEEIHHG